MSNQKANKATQYLTCEDLRHGFKLGFYDVQSHGLTHVNLTQIDDKKLVNELEKSQKILQECLAELPENRSVALHFGYPYNKVNHKVEEYTQKYYLSAYRYNRKLPRLWLPSNPYQISRIGIYREDSLKKLIKLADKASFISQLNQKVY